MPKPSLRDAILDAGLKEMFRTGYHGTSVRDVTAAAGAPQGSFTNHFRSKELFASEVLDRYFLYVRGLVAEALSDTSLPPRDSAEAASTEVARNGDGIKVRPISSMTMPASTQPSPLPPNWSGTNRPEKPISAKVVQSSREKPVASLLSRKDRRCATGALSLMRPRALSRSMDCSSVRTRAMENPI